MIAPTEQQLSPKERLSALDTLIAETSSLIQDQVQLIKEAGLVGESTKDANYALEIMIEIQASQLVQRERLTEQLSLSKYVGPR